MRVCVLGGRGVRVCVCVCVNGEDNGGGGGTVWMYACVEGGIYDVGVAVNGVG